jgi:hypothetical protein
MMRNYTISEFRLEKLDYTDYKANQLEDGWMYAQGTFYIR